MTSPGGHWVLVPIPGTPGRQDWVPDQQYPSPDGHLGEWHVIPDLAGGPSRWEWMPAAPAPLPLAVIPARRPIADRPGPGVFAPEKPGRRMQPRTVAVLGAACVFVAALLGGVLLSRSGGGASAATVSDEEAAVIEQAGLSESACEDARPKVTDDPAVSHIYKCRGFDLYIYNATHARDVWVAEWQKQGRTVMKTGPHWIALNRLK